MPSFRKQAETVLNAFVCGLELWDIVVPRSGLFRTAVEVGVRGEVGYAGCRDIVGVAANLDVNSFCCIHGGLGCIVADCLSPVSSHLSHIQYSIQECSLRPSEMSIRRASSVAVA